MIEESSKKVIWSLTFLFIGILYLPFILKGGFLVDDWAIVQRSVLHENLYQIIASWFPQLTFRPMAGLLFSVIAYLFGTSPIGYILLNLTFLLISLTIIVITLRNYTTVVFSSLLFILSSTPIIASSIIFAPASLINFNTTLLLWSISFYILIVKYINTNKIWYYLISYLLLTVAFLIYEGFAPLLVISFLFPIFVHYHQNKEEFRTKYILIISKYLSPIFTILAVILTYQKILVPAIGGYNLSRFHYNLSLINIAYSVIQWLLSVFINPFLLMFNSVPRLGYSIITRVDLLLILVIATLLIYKLYRSKFSTRENLYRKDKILIILIFLLALLSNNIITIFSGYGSIIGGYENRILASSWIVLSLIIAYIFDNLRKKLFYFVFVGLFLLLSFSFVIHRDNYISSYDLQLKIAEAAAKDVKNKTDEKGLFVLGNVPLYLPNNFNNEQVFDVAWDFGPALSLKSDGRINKANVITREKLESGRASLSDGVLKIDISQYPKDSIDWDKFYYFEYNQGTHESNLTKIANYQQLEEIIHDIELSNLNTSPTGVKLVEFKLSPLELKIIVKKSLLKIGVKKFWKYDDR